MKSLDSLFQENNGNKHNPDNASSNINLDNLNEEQLYELAIKQSLEQENLEIERDREEQLIQLAILNSIEEINEKKEKKEENIIKMDEEKQEEEKFDENFGICPIKLEYMKHPVLTPSGNYYEKSAIIEWIKKNHTDPMTREKLTIDMLMEDKEYSLKIKEYRKKFKKEIQDNND